MNEKIIEKLAKIRRHEESARKIGSLEEAEAFASMLQRLLTQYKLAMSDVEFEQHEREEPIDEHPVDWQDVKVRQTRVAWIERLASIVGRAHFCRLLVHPRSSRITLLGREGDAKVAEYLLVVLVRTLERLSHDAAYRGDKSERGYGYRQAYIDGFVKRLGERFEEERRAAQATSSTALIRLTDSMTKVNNYVSRYPAAGRVGGRPSQNFAGYQDGRDAADRVQLRANAMERGAQPGTKAIGGSR